MVNTQLRYTLLPLLFAGSAATFFACGDEPSKQFADAKPIDAPTVDAPAIDATTSGVVEISVVDFAGPVTGATVLFQNADDSVVATKTTDATGIASQSMNAGGSITAIVAGLSDTTTYTILAVKPGDKLKIRARSNGVEQALTGVTLSLPANSFGTYQVLSSCGTKNSGVTINNSGGLAVNVPLTCTQASWLIKREGGSGSGGTTAAAIYKANVALANGGFDLSDQTFAALVSQNIDASNVPANFRMDASVVSVLGGFLGEIDEAQAIITPPGSPSFATTFQRAASTATKQVVRLDIRSNLGFQKFVALGDVGDVSFDGATGLTPWVSDATFMQANSSFTLTTTPGGSAPVNGAFAQLGISRKSGFISRQVVGPSFAGLRLPILPTPQAEFNVVAADSAFINGAGIISSPGGYDALRPRYFTTDSSEEFFAGAPNINAQLCVSLFFNKR